MNDAELLACAASSWEGDPKRCRWCNAELVSPRRRWCSGECASEFARNHWWPSARNAALHRDGYACVECGGKRGAGVRLEVHHKTPLSELAAPARFRPGDRARHADTGCHHHLDGLVTLCCWRRDGKQPCHHRAHHGEKPEQLAIGAA